MTSQRPDPDKIPESAPQTQQAAPAAIYLPALTEEQRVLLEAYRLGRLDEKRFQDYLADDPILSDYVHKVCRPTAPSTRTH